MIKKLTALFLLAVTVAGQGLIVNPYRFASSGGSGPSNPGTLNTSLIAYWKMDEASGNALDSEPTGTAQDLTDNNTVTSAGGRVGNARQFTASNTEYFSRTSEADLVCGDIDFTWAAWFYLDSLGAQRTIISKSSSDQTEYQIDITSGNQVRFFVYTPTGPAYYITSTSGFSPSTGTWYFVVGWHDATADTVNVQVNNGTVYSVSTLGRAPRTSTADLQFGRYQATTPTLFWNGRIDEIGFWKKKLTDDEKTYLYFNGAGRTITDF